MEVKDQPGIGATVSSGVIRYGMSVNCECYWCWSIQI